MKPFGNMKPFKGDETNTGVSLDVKCTIDLNPHSLFCGLWSLSAESIAGENLLYVSDR